ncbi:MAG TPA: NAD(P)/FAD-dependent oxidoreductase [Dehalococcoidia bacterium]|nr:NAD(P)/FAD-dependent oxidoreductase [Dehalococcoidia bacterium]
MTKKYDVIIVGGGPAGIFASLELSDAGLDVLLLDKGKEIDARICPIQRGSERCMLCSPCHLVSGFGGAGAFSDGKLTLSTKVGGRLKELIGSGQAEVLVDYVDDIYVKFGAPHKVYGLGEKVAELERQATLAGLRLTPVKLRHMGTENCRQVLKAMQKYLSPKIEIKLRTEVKSIIVEDGIAKAIETSNGERLDCSYLILSPGREGSEWLTNEATRLKLSLNSNPIDVGVRIETPSAIMEELTSVLYESKLEFYSKTFDDRVRTFCMCPGGEVIMESTGGSDPVITVNGIGYAEKKTKNTNFAILVSTTFTEPFHEPIAYGKYLARLANILSGGVLVQRLGDLMEGRRSTKARLQRSLIEPSLKAATPGDLSFALPFRYLKGVVEMLQAMDKLAPGVASPHSLLYGIEVKFYSSQLKLTPCLETEIGNMFAAGDGAGISRGLVQASASGVVIAREILRRLGKKKLMMQF